MKPDHFRARDYLGVVLLKEGKYEAAMAQFRESLRIHPDYTAALGNLELTRELMPPQ
ncbi:MAG: tetratricopeptide repeat protein [bacterium]|nr:tetratricopeptide repeat protein [bacterium]